MNNLYTCDVFSFQFIYISYEKLLFLKIFCDMNSNPTSPINTSTSLEYYLKCTDFSVSGEQFYLVRDTETDLLITSPQPDLDLLPKYYETEAYISHTDANTSFFDKIYQFVKQYTLKQKLHLLKNLTSNADKSILDIGCGTGDFLKVCQLDKWKCVGIEPNSNARELAKSKLNDLNIYAEIKYVPENQKFDIITLWHVLEHIPNLEDYILFFKKHLKVGGKLIVAVPNYKSFDATYYGKFWAAYDVPRHLWHFSVKAIKTLFAKHKMQVVEILPMKFDSYYVSLLSEKYKRNNKKNRLPLRNPITAFFIGLRSNLKAKHTKQYSSLIYILKNQ